MFDVAPNIGGDEKWMDSRSGEGFSIPSRRPSGTSFMASLTSLMCMIGSLLLCECEAEELNSTVDMMDTNPIESTRSHDRRWWMSWWEGDGSDVDVDWHIADDVEVADGERGVASVTKEASSRSTLFAVMVDGLWLRRRLHWFAWPCQRLLLGGQTYSQTDSRSSQIFATFSRHPPKEYPQHSFHIQWTRWQSLPNNNE